MLISRFEEQVARTPGKLAVKGADGSFTYGELSREAGYIGALIREQWPVGSKCDPGHGHVALLFDHGAPMVAGVLGVLKAGGVYVPISPAYPPRRIDYILDHADISFILTDSANQRTAEEHAENRKKNTGQPLPVLNIETIKKMGKMEKMGTMENVGGVGGADRPAYILYTSGSTGNPRGVMQSHGGVLYYAGRFGENLAIGENDRMTLFSSLSHDAAVMDIYGGLLRGATLYPRDIRTESGFGDILAWLHREQITLWHSVPTFYRRFVNHLADPAADTGADTGFFSPRLFVLGGEEVLRHDIDMCRGLFPRSTLCNLYGQTESSYNATAFFPPESDDDTVTIGDVVEGAELFVVDEDGHEVAPLETGEIVVACPHVSPGYWKEETASEEVFVPDPDHGRLYLTGDLGTLQRDGGIRFAGRRDFQVKIRGFRIEPGEIETVMMGHPRIKEAVVVALGGEEGDGDRDGDRYLCAYYVPVPPPPGEGELEAGELRQYLADGLPDYMVPNFLVPLGRMPLTTTGKIDRLALPAPEKKSAAPYRGAETVLEQEVAGIWSEILGVPGPIGMDSNFFELGGDSLKALEVVSRIHKSLDSAVPVPEFFARPTIRQLSRYVGGMEKDIQASIRAVEKREYYPLSSAQKRIYAMQQMNRDGVSYNIFDVVEIAGDLDPERLNGAFREMIRRHETLRTSIQIIGKEPVQRIHGFDGPDFRLGRREVEGGGAVAAIRDLIRPFDMARAPFLRATLIETGGAPPLLLVDIHHIIADGISQQIFVRDLFDLYAGESPPPLEIQYRDFAHWQNRLLAAGAIEAQEKYWLDRFREEVPPLTLPFDYPLAAGPRSDEGGRLHFSLTRELTHALYGFMKETGTTAHMVLSAVFYILLSKYSGREDIVVGTPISGRRHHDLGNIIGMFVNMLPLRNQPRGDKTFIAFLEEVKKNSLDAYENQDYQFEELVKTLRGRGPDHTAVKLEINVVFAHLNLPYPGVEKSGLIFKPFPYKKETSKFDLRCAVVEAGEDVRMSFTYSTARFKAATVEKIKERYIEILDQVMADSRIKLADIKVSHELVATHSDRLGDYRESFDF